MKSVAVVGTINRDRIIGADGSVTESLGGILYNTLALAALLEGTGAAVLPRGRLGAEDRDEAIALLAGFPAVNPAGLIADPAGTNLSTLDYTAGGERVEHVDLRVAPLTPDDVAGIGTCDAVLVNMISGRDVEPGTLRGERADASRWYLDIQALARTQERPRRPRRVPDWRDWCGLFDVVRGNREEIASFAGTDTAEDAVPRILAAGAEEVLATAGPDGILRGIRDGTEQRIPAVPGPEAGDPTGCGDAFLSAVCAGRLLGLRGADPVRLGAFVAAEVAAGSGLASLAGLRGVRSRATRALGLPGGAL